MRIGYARVSTKDQDAQYQIDALEKNGCEKVFVDVGVSGTLASRPQWDACLDFARKGDVVVVWKLDRAGRSTKHLIELSSKLKDAGIGFASIDESIDTSTPMGEFFFTVMAGVAQLERDLNAERTKESLAERKARGIVGGRKPSYTPEQKATVVELSSSLGATAIATETGLSRNTVNRILKAAAKESEASAIATA